MKASALDDTAKVRLGFWIYLMTDCILFASLFATYAVLRFGVGDGPTASDIFDLPYVLVETFLLLASSFTAGLALIAAQKKLVRPFIGFFVATFILGAMFLGMEIHEFIALYRDGHGWDVSGFLSSYFTLVGTHGLHILTGLIWLASLFTLVVRKGFTSGNMKRLTMFTLFWHFLDLVWIFIFTVVYLIGDKTI